MNVEKYIRKKFHVKRNDTPPYCGYYDSTRADLADLFGELGYTYGAEVGVSRAVNAMRLFRRVPNLKLMCVDPWRAFKRNSDEKMSRIYQVAQKRLKDNDVIWKRMTSVEASKTVEDESLDFVYIDGMHDFDNVMIDLIHWVPKVRKDGIVSGHDYFNSYQQGVIKAVNAYIFAHGIIHLHVTKDERCPSFFWVKN